MKTIRLYLGIAFKLGSLVLSIPSVLMNCLAELVKNKEDEYPF